LIHFYKRITWHVNIIDKFQTGVPLVRSMVFQS